MVWLKKKLHKNMIQSPGKREVGCKVTFLTSCQIVLKIGLQQSHHLFQSVALSAGQTWKSKCKISLKNFTEDASKNSSSMTLHIKLPWQTMPWAFHIARKLQKKNNPNLKALYIWHSYEVWERRRQRLNLGEW